MRRPRKTPSLIGFAFTCGLLGVLVGGSAALAEEHQCAQAKTPSANCLTVPPVVRFLEKTTSGLVAGTCAALSIGWKSLH